MKTLANYIFFIFVLFSFNSIGQNFPKKDVGLLMNKELKVIIDSESKDYYSYREFFKDKNLKKGFTNDFALANFVNEVFLVTQIDPFILDYDNEIPCSRLKLENKKIGTIYFRYISKYEFDFPFEVIGGLKLPEDYYCQEIEVSVDKFTGETNYQTPLERSYSFTKVKKGNESRIYMRVEGSSLSLVSNAKGLILLLENGFKIEKPDIEIGIDVHPLMKGYYQYIAFFELNSSDIELLTKNKITDSRIYVIDSHLIHTKDLKEYLKCLLKD